MMISLYFCKEFQKELTPCRIVGVVECFQELPCIDRSSHVVPKPLYFLFGDSKSNYCDCKSASNPHTSICFDSQNEVSQGQCYEWLVTRTLNVLLLRLVKL